MIQKITSFLLLIIILGGITISSQSCDVETKKMSDKITVSPREVEITKEEYFFELEVTTEAGWTVKSNKDWIVPYYEVGFGDFTLSVDYQYNDTEEERVAKLTFEADGDEIDVIVTQEAGGIFDCYVTHVEDAGYKNDLEYDSNNKITKYTVEKQGSTYVHDFEYNLDNKIIREDITRDGVADMFTLFYYNSDDNLSQFKKYNSNKYEKIFECNIQYNSNGFPSRVDYDFVILPDFYKIFTYDTSGNLVEEKIYDTIDDELSTKYTNSYDDKRNPITEFPNWKKQKHNLLNSTYHSYTTGTTLEFEYKYQYNEHGYPTTYTKNGTFAYTYMYNCPSE